MNDKIKHKFIKNTEGNHDEEYIYKESKKRQEILFSKMKRKCLVNGLRNCAESQ